MPIFVLSNGPDLWQAFSFVSSGADIIYGLGSDDIIEGGAGSDFVYGGSGNDRLAAYEEWPFNNPVISSDGGFDLLYGESGNDRLYGDADADLLDGGSGNDYMAGYDGDDVYYVDSAFDVVDETGNGNDTVMSSVTYRLSGRIEALTLAGLGSINGTGNGSANAITGNSGANTLDGAGGNDFVLGGDGNDLILGGAGNDELAGEAGNDTVRGQGGNDVLRGGAGVDALVGGSGSDTFQFLTAAQSSPGGRDTLAAGDGATAFQGAGAAVGDVIDLSAIFGSDLSFGGRLTLVNSGTNTIVRANTDGDAAIEFELLIQDGAVLASAYRASDFIL